MRGGLSWICWNGVGIASSAVTTVSGEVVHRDVHHEFELRAR
jgi:hypothetical protein